MTNRVPALAASVASGALAALHMALSAANPNAPPATATPAPARPAAALPDGAVLYASRCAVCHDHPADRIPPKVFIATIRTAEDVIDTLTMGVMRTQAQGLSAAQIEALAVYLTGKPPAPRAPPSANLCHASAAVALTGRDWRSWGRDPTNSRLQPQGLTAAQVPRLKLRWTFAYPGRAAFGQPAVVGGLVLAACEFTAYGSGAIAGKELRGRSSHALVYVGDAWLSAMHSAA